MTPGVCLVGTLFLLQIASLCPSFALAKASRPTNNKVSRKKHIERHKVYRGCWRIFFRWWDRRDLATSQGQPGQRHKFCGETRKLVRSHHKTWSDACKAVCIINLKVYYQTGGEGCVLCGLWVSRGVVYNNLAQYMGDACFRLLSLWISCYY